MKRKPYKSLDQVYLSESFAKPVPLLPRQTILKEQPGMAEILIQKDPGEQLPVFKVPNEVANEILARIRRAEVYEAEKEEDKQTLSVDSIIAKCLEVDRWAPEGKGQKSAVFNDVARAFDSVDLNYKEFNKLYSLQTDKDNPIRNVLLKDLEVHNIKDLLSDKFKALFKAPEDAFKVLEALWSIEPKSQANVGPGELALTMISDAKKGVEGDLEFDFGAVEVKGNNAALGSGKVANTETYEGLNKLLATHASGISVQSTNVASQRERIKRDILELKSRYSSTRRNKFTSTDPTTRQKIINDLENILLNLENTDKLIEAVNRSNLDNDSKTYLNNLIGILQQIEKGEATSIRGKKSKFAPAIAAFFSQNLNPEIKIEGTKYLRSSSDTNQNEIAEVARELLKTYPDLLDFTGRSTSPLYRFIGAVHVAEYQREKPFKYIIFFNSDAEKASDIRRLPTKIVAMYVEPGSFTDSVKNIFSFFNRKNINMSISLGVDNTRGTVRVALG
jgi:hypothetical protein